MSYLLTFEVLCNFITVCQCLLCLSLYSDKTIFGIHNRSAYNYFKLFVAPLAFRIHISQKTKEILDDIGGYYTEYRGPIEFEGGMKTTSYWLTGGFTSTTTTD